MPSTHHTIPRDLDARALDVLLSGHSRVNEAAEIGALRLGWEPEWERPHRNGVDITDRPDLWTPYQRARRESYDARAADYRARGLV